MAPKHHWEIRSECETSELQSEIPFLTVHCKATAVRIGIVQNEAEELNRTRSEAVQDSGHVYCFSPGCQMATFEAMEVMCMCENY